jgi:hypothetical protein
MKDLLRMSIICAIISASVSYWMTTNDEDTHTSMFCAYGKVFVTFKQFRTVWGTMLLDDRGLPVTCDSNDLKKEDPKFFKGSI